MPGGSPAGPARACAAIPDPLRLPARALLQPLHGPEAARLLTRMGGEVRIYDAHGLPLPDDAPAAHPKVQELRALSTWSEGQVWVSPERHGTLTGVMKSQIDWLPLSEGAVRPTQGRTLAVMQVSGGSQSFNAVNAMRVLGRWMRMVTVPNQSSIPKAFQEFDAAGRLGPGPYLRPGGRRLRGAVQVHADGARAGRVSRGPLQRAQGAGARGLGQDRRRPGGRGAAGLTAARATRRAAYWDRTIGPVLGPTPSGTGMSVPP